MNAGERLEREDVDAPFFISLLRTLCLTFSPFFSDQYWLCLRVERRDKHGFLKQLLAIGHAPVRSACLTSEILRAQVTRKRKERKKSFPSLTSSLNRNIPSFIYLFFLTSYRPSRPSPHS